ncbi:MAG: SDR family NAD(P)-dependent oxidoreductase [bacterium]|jgi:NAD(P)-dependent dehydrogenase (short-subunit alcohol dehydrogenase family)
MKKRLEGKVAIVVGAGQTPGEGLGNGRATALVFAREGAQVLAVDRSAEAADATVAEILDAGGIAQAVAADATNSGDCQGFVARCIEKFGRVDILHNNVGIGDGDSTPAHLDEAGWDRIIRVNLKSVALPCREVLPLMRQQKSGVITNISSIAATCAMPIVAYKVSKAGLNAYTQSLAMTNARYGIRANVVAPGLINTPMAMEGISAALDISREELATARDAQVPLRAKMGSAWDVAHAALFLASDEAGFITGVVLPVDGGQSARIG